MKYFNNLLAIAVLLCVNIVNAQYRVVRHETNDAITYSDGTITAKRYKSGNYSASIKVTNRRHTRALYDTWQLTEPEEHYRRLEALYNAQDEPVEEFMAMKEPEEFSETIIEPG